MDLYTYTQRIYRITETGNHFIVKFKDEPNLENYIELAIVGSVDMNGLIILRDKLSEIIDKNNKAIG